MSNFYRYAKIGALVELFLSWDGDKRGGGCYWQLEDGTLEVWAGGLYLSLNRPTIRDALDGDDGTIKSPHGP